MDEAFRKSDILNLAHAIERRVVRPHGIGMDASLRFATIHASLNLSHDRIFSSVNALCTITVHHDWQQNLPEVVCRDHWLKRDIDWHVYKDGGLCYDLDLRWRSKVSKVLQCDGMRAASDFAAEWCLHHSKALLWKHYYAYCNNIEQWQPDWPAWGHSEKGRKEYRLEQLQKRIEKGLR